MFLTYVLSKDTDPAHPVYIRQLFYISRGDCKITPSRGKDNHVTNALYPIDTSHLPTQIGLQELFAEQVKDEQLKACCPILGIKIWNYSI